FHLTLTFFEPFAPTPERLVDGFWRRSQAELKDREGEANRPRTFVVLQRLGSVEFLAHVIRDLFIQPRFRIRQLVGNSLGDPLWEQRSAVEFQKRLLHHASHEVRRIHGVNTVPESALESVAIEK